MPMIYEASSSHRRAGLTLVATAAGLMLVMVAGVALAGSAPLTDSPVVWYDADTDPIPVPQEAEPGLVPYALDSFVARPFSRFWHPGRFIRWVGTGDRVLPAGNINALDEVVNSTWFTNRIGLHALDPMELAEGPALGTGLATGPDQSEPWTIIGAKTAGVTPGFRIRDARGDVWLLKFDPPHHPGMTIRAGVVAGLLFHAMGFNVPIDRVVTFKRDDLVIGEGARMKMGRIGEIAMTPANLDSVLESTQSVFGGEYHALASRYLVGIPIGPFDDQGHRADDPTDRIRHENRRELRALAVFAAWMNHFDTKMHNSLDMYVGEPGEGYVKHHLIDFASTMGGYGDAPVRRFGFEYGFDVFPIMGRTLTLGAVEDRWIPLLRPEGLDEIGLFDTATFEPGKWKADLPHSGMANLTRRDGYWAAKILSAFDDDDLWIVVNQGRYRNPAAADFLVRTLAGRRDLLVEYWFDRVPPVDFFALDASGMTFRDLGLERGFVPPGETRYRYRLAAVDAERRPGSGGWTKWSGISSPAIPLFDVSGVPRDDGRHPFLAMEVQLDRGRGWSASTTVYASYESGRIVALDR